MASKGQGAARSVRVFFLFVKKKKEKRALTLFLPLLLLNSSSNPTVPPPQEITPRELAEHSTPGDCWTALRGKVYDMTPYLKFHPGGSHLLVAVGGKDATRVFDAYHAWVNAGALLASCLVGKLVEGGEGDGGEGGERAAEATVAEVEAAADAAEAAFLDARAEATKAAAAAAAAAEVAALEAANAAADGG